MTADQLRQKFITFFESKGHKRIPSASLVPENDPTVLFTTAGMHPLIPFLLGEPHPAGKRLVNVQRCIRTGDIDLVGDDTHLTFFEMLGNWSLGDSDAADGIGAGYWKEEAIQWSWEFLTKELKLDPTRLFVTCFAGDKDAPKDTESAEIWNRQPGFDQSHLGFLGKEDNWWGPAGQTGPCGPDTEMFYQVNTTEDDRPGNIDWPKGKYVEIWNDVFMQYNKTADGKFEPLKQKNVDTGMGVERTLTVLQTVNSVYETDLFSNDVAFLLDRSKEKNEKSIRIILDHFKAAVFLIADGIIPSNKEQGYVLRRLIRKWVREVMRVGIYFKSNENTNIDQVLLDRLVNKYSSTYPLLIEKKEEILSVISKEHNKFKRTLDNGLKILIKELHTLGIYGVGMYGKAQFGKGKFSGKVAFDLYQSYGFPRELIEDELGKIPINDDEWKAEEQKHQELSRSGGAQKFAGGLADHSTEVIRMHTATHLLHQALRDVLGDHVFQKGSNITKERLRFDFTHPTKMTDEEKQMVEQIVNEKIKAAIPVERKVLPLEEGRKLGAIGLFGEKYGETVSVYTIGDYSKEFCGGPHVTNTREIGTFKIKKEEAVSAGVRRIKAIVQ